MNMTKEEKIEYENILNKSKRIDLRNSISQDIVIKEFISKEYSNYGDIDYWFISNASNCIMGNDMKLIINDEFLLSDKLYRCIEEFIKTKFICESNTEKILFECTLFASIIRIISNVQIQYINVDYTVAINIMTIPSVYLDLCTRFTNKFLKSNVIDVLNKFVDLKNEKNYKSIKKYHDDKDMLIHFLSAIEYSMGLILENNISNKSFECIATARNQYIDIINYK